MEILFEQNETRNIEKITKKESFIDADSFFIAHKNDNF